MKTWLSIFATIVVVLCVAGIASLTAAGDVVPAILPTVALGAFAGGYALLAVPTWGDLAIAVLIVAAIVVLSFLHDAIPTSLPELLAVALAGHFALEVPDTPAPPAPAPESEVVKVTVPAGTKVSSGESAVMIGGQ